MKKINRQQLRSLINELSTSRARPEQERYIDHGDGPESQEDRISRRNRNMDIQRRYVDLMGAEMSVTQAYLEPLVEEALRQIGYSGGKYDQGTFSTSFSDDAMQGKLRAPVLEIGVPGENNERPLVYIGFAGGISSIPSLEAPLQQALSTLDRENQARFV
jgi:hypothetical protein